LLFTIIGNPIIKVLLFIPILVLAKIPYRIPLWYITLIDNFLRSEKSVFGNKLPIQNRMPFFHHAFPMVKTITKEKPGKMAIAEFEL